MSAVTYEDTLREITTDAGVLRYTRRVSPLDMALIPMRTIPNAESHVFANCGHWTMIEAKEAFESTVLAFVLRKDAAELS